MIWDVEKFVSANLLTNDLYKVSSDGADVLVCKGNGGKHAPLLLGIFWVDYLLFC